MSLRSSYSSSSSSAGTGNTSPISLSSLITSLDRKLTAFTVSTLAQAKQQREQQQQYFRALESGGSSPHGLGRSLFESIQLAHKQASTATAFVLVEPRSPQAFPLLGFFDFPLPLLHQVGLIFITVVLCVLGFIFLKEAAHSTHQNVILSTLSALVLSPIMAILTGNTAALGNVGLSSDFPSRVANAVASGLGHAFPSANGVNTSSSSWAQRSFGTDAGANNIMLSPNGKGRALRRSRAASPSHFNGNAAAAAAAAAARANDADEAGHYPGLRNTGNTCFFNSVIQSLASCPTLAQHLDAVTQFAEVWDVPTPVTDALRDIVIRLNSPATRRESAILPSHLTAALADVSASNGLRSLTAAHQQQDAHELFALLSDALESELREIQRERRAVLFSSSRGLAAAIAPTRPRSTEWVVPSPPEQNGNGNAEGLDDAAGTGAGAETGTEAQQAVAVADEQPGDPQHPFKGWTAQRTGCVDCGYTEGIRHLSSEELTLTVPQLGAMRGNRGVALEQLLDEWSKLEVVQWICHRCSLRATAERLRGDVVRMGGEDPAGRALMSNNSSAANGHHDGEATGKMTVSKKRRLKDAQRAYERIVRILQLNIHEDELQSANPPLLPPDVKLERIPSRCATKQIMLARPPRLLVVHLNRSIFGGFGGGASKNNTFVHFGEWLDMQPFATGAELEVRSDRRISGGGDDDGDQNSRGQSALQRACLYRLQSIVVHYGGHSFGHYVSYRRKPSTIGTRSRGAEWMRISDDIVEPCDLGEVLASNPFLLFYERWDGLVGQGGGGDVGPGAYSQDSSDSDHGRGGATKSKLSTAAEVEPARITPLDDIDDFSGEAASRAVANMRILNEASTSTSGQNASGSSDTLVPSKEQETAAAQLEQLRVRVRPRVVQRWESPAPRASL
ncbi:hypothetical protein CF326_g4408 [Tilletia indica]|nr:hypothetical protein CF326_g4408 [Tilletia indica]